GWRRGSRLINSRRDPDAGGGGGAAGNVSTQPSVSSGDTNFNTSLAKISTGHVTIATVSRGARESRGGKAQRKPRLTNELLVSSMGKGNRQQSTMGEEWRP
ncbi:hypothetical protein CLAIMM_04034, partial [Cladophialophora immunda]